MMSDVIVFHMLHVSRIKPLPEGFDPIPSLPGSLSVNITKEPFGKLA